MPCYQLSRFFFYQAGMKQTEHSDTTVHPDVESSATSERVRKSNRLTALHGKMMKGTLIILSVAFFITIYVLANRNSHTSNENNEFIPVVNGRSLEVEVLDGAGSMNSGTTNNKYPPCTRL